MKRDKVRALEPGRVTEDDGRDCWPQGWGMGLGVVLEGNRQDLLMDHTGGEKKREEPRMTSMLGAVKSSVTATHCSAVHSLTRHPPSPLADQFCPPGPHSAVGRILCN